MSNQFNSPEFFPDDTQRFLAALSSSDFLGDLSSLQHTSGADGPASLSTAFAEDDFTSLGSGDINSSLRDLITSSGESGESDASSFTNAASVLSATTIGKSQSPELSTGAKSQAVQVKLELSPSMRALQNMSSSTPSTSNLSLEADKRKVGDEIMSDDDLSENDSKRREVDMIDQDEPKRLGRKLMAVEPSSKRKAQNRAAQRAFRERKEKHLRDLETRVEELENDAHNMNTENHFLKKQVDRLQAELKEYRKRQLSTSRNSPVTGATSFSAPFTFEFPLFGANAKQAKSSSQPLSSVASPTSTTSSFSSAAPFATQAQLYASSPYSPHGITGLMSPDTGAPTMQHTPSSVTGVPHPAKPEENFCAQLSMACGTRDNPIPKLRDSSILSPPSFETELFSEYRDSIFPGSEEEFTLPELTPDDIFDTGFMDSSERVSSRSSSSSNTADRTKTLTSSFPEPKIKQEPEDEVVPADNKPFMGCTALWDRISMHPKFGDLDIDGLCSELRTKAKCSESGVVVTESDFNDVLKKIDSDN
ncbi:transcription factor PAP1-domain-containing protein [Lipomyces oligophaga]|uniref:transcription factor PAP1-domain-containing protein n=1 Tax=Lipomyces oligophaga TaxID=45792 RepID=UPI0034CF4960